MFAPGIRPIAPLWSLFWTPNTRSDPQRPVMPIRVCSHMRDRESRPPSLLPDHPRSSPSTGCPRLLLLLYLRPLPPPLLLYSVGGASLCSPPTPSRPSIRPGPFLLLRFILAGSFSFVVLGHPSVRLRHRLCGGGSVGQ